jgi:hypothetical protein
LEQLADKQGERATKLREALRSTEEEIRRFQWKRDLPGSPRGQIERMRRQIEQQLRLTSPPEEARRVEHAMRRLATGPAGSPQQRVEHLRSAIHHLHEAGMHEQAEELEHAARRLADDFKASARDGFLGPPTFIPNPPPHGPGQPMEHKMDEMRREMQTMREDLNELRKRLERLLLEHRSHAPQGGRPSGPPELRE